MPRSASQNEAMREATRQAILASAMTLFAQNGYAHTSTRSIAGAAGISTGLIYHYFDSKEQLLQAVFEGCLQRLGAALQYSYEHSVPRERLPAMLTTIFEMLAEEPDFWTLFNTLRSQPAILRLTGDALRHWTGRLRNVFEAELRRLGRSEPLLDAYVLYSLIEGTIQQYLLDPQSYPLQQVSAAIVAAYRQED